MQSYLLKNILISDPSSPFHGQTGDLAIRDGLITGFGEVADESDFLKVIDFTGCIATPAFVDVRCNSSEPGYEHRETIRSLNHAAFAGGYAHVALLPNCDPPRQTRSDIEFLVNQVKDKPVSFLPIGAITKDLKTDELAEMYDMKKHGAVAFANANHPVSNIGTMSRALQYTRSFDGLIYSFCHQHELSQGAYVAEGTVAVSLGLKGIPQMAEYLQVQRDIELADYHQANIHLSKISTERSVELIRQAKLQGIKVTCDVAVMNLVLTDETIMDFDSNLKLTPPLRQANDVKALWEGLRDGTIDAICSDHHPQDTEHKAVEFEYASYGAITIQIAFSLAVEGRNRFCPGLEDSVLISKFNEGGARVLGLKLNRIAENDPASFTLINPNKQTMLTSRNNLSLAQNTYYLDKPLPYFIEATCIGHHVIFNKN
jgi:dihydroorotase